MAEAREGCDPRNCRRCRTLMCEKVTGVRGGSAARDDFLNLARPRVLHVVQPAVGLGQGNETTKPEKHRTRALGEDPED